MLYELCLVNIIETEFSNFLKTFNSYRQFYNVLEEKAADMVVREDDKTFIADFYKYGFVGLVLEWIDKGMKEDPKQIIERLNAM